MWTVAIGQQLRQLSGSSSEQWLQPATATSPPSQRSRRGKQGPARTKNSSSEILTKPWLISRLFPLTLWTLQTDQRVVCAWPPRI